MLIYQKTGTQAILKTGLIIAIIWCVLGYVGGGMAYALSLDVESKTVHLNQGFDLNINIQDASNLGYIQFAVTFPSEYLKLVNATAKETALIADPDNPGNKALYAMNPEEYPAGQERTYRFGWVYGGGYDDDGQLVSLSFQLKKMSSFSIPVSLPINIESSIAAQATGSLTEQAVLNIDGLVSVHGLRGDVTDDGLVDLKDCITTLQILGDMQTIYTFLDAKLRPGVDINGDKQVGLAEAIFCLQAFAK